MSSLLQAKRKFEVLYGPVTFMRVRHVPDNDVLLYQRDRAYVRYNLIGRGKTHLDAIADAHHQLRALRALRAGR